LIKYFCQQQFKQTSVEVLLDRYSPTPYHYTALKVGYLPPVKCPSSPVPSQTPPPSHLPLGSGPH